MDDSYTNSDEKRIDKLIKLGQAEKEMGKMMSPVPSRPTLISYVKKGVLKGKRIFNNYYIYESSLQEFIEKHQVNPKK